MNEEPTVGAGDVTGGEDELPIKKKLLKVVPIKIVGQLKHEDLLTNFVAAMVIAIVGFAVGIFVTGRIENAKHELEAIKAHNQVSLVLLEQKQEVMIGFADVIPRARMISEEYKGLEFLLYEHEAELRGLQVRSSEADRVRREIERVEQRKTLLMDAWWNGPNYTSASQMAVARMGDESGVRIRRMLDWFDMLTTLRIEKAETNFKEFRSMLEGLPSTCFLSSSFGEDLQGSGIDGHVLEMMREDHATQRWIETFRRNYSLAEQWCMASQVTESDRVKRGKNMTLAMRRAISVGVDILYVEAMYEMQREMRELEQSLVSPQEVE